MKKAFFLFLVIVISFIVSTCNFDKNELPIQPQSIQKDDPNLSIPDKHNSIHWNLNIIDSTLIDSLVNEELEPKDTLKPPK